MNEFLQHQDIMKICKVTEWKAKDLIRETNKNLSKQGFITLRGRVNKKFILHKLGLDYLINEEII